MSSATQRIDEGLVGYIMRHIRTTGLVTLSPEPELRVALERLAANGEVDEGLLAALPAKE